MTRRIAAVLAAFVVVATASCRPGAGPAVPPATATPATGTPAAAASPTAAGTAPVPSSSPLGNAPPTQNPFGRHDTPPGGVAAFLEFGAGAGNLCEDFGQVPPAVRLVLAPLPVAVCAFGFEPKQPIDFMLRSPAGVESLGTVEADTIGRAEWDLADLPSPIGGAYAMRATQGALSAESTSRVAVDDINGQFLPDVIRPGQTGRLLVAGGVPGAALPAYLYFSDDSEPVDPDTFGGPRYIADLGPLQLDANGEGRMELTPQPGDPIGSYVIVVDPTPGGAPGESTDFPPLPSGTAADFVALAESAGLVCPGPDVVDCEGDIAGVGFTMSLFLDDSGAVTGVSATAEGPSPEVPGFFGAMARIATGSTEAGDWTRSATGSDQRRFGDVVVQVNEDPDGGRQVMIDPFTGSHTGEIWALFLVQP